MSAETLCEGRIEVFDRLTHKNLGSFTCTGASQCLRRMIWGEKGKVVGLGITCTASVLSGLPEDRIMASFNSKCVTSK
jgi:hypothetical protein